MQFFPFACSGDGHFENSPLTSQPLWKKYLPDQFLNSNSGNSLSSTPGVMRVLMRQPSSISTAPGHPPHNLTHKYNQDLALPKCVWYLLCHHTAQSQPGLCSSLGCAKARSLSGGPDPGSKDRAVPGAGDMNGPLGPSVLSQGWNKNPDEIPAGNLLRGDPEV